MATATKTARTLLASGTVAAGGSRESAWLDLRTALGALITGRCTNGETGPTVGCDFIVETSPDNGTTIREYSRQTAGTANATSYDFAVALPAGAMYARVRTTGNTVQDVTSASEAQELTSIA